MRRRFCRVRGHAAEKARMLHWCVFRVICWCAGSRVWGHMELKVARSLQLRMCRRALNLWPRQDESIADYNKLAARWCDVWTAARVPRSGTMRGLLYRSRPDSTPLVSRVARTRLSADDALQTLVDVASPGTHKTWADVVYGGHVWRSTVRPHSPGSYTVNSVHPADPPHILAGSIISGVASTNSERG